jgi:ABC-type enterochelin transport system substrate-binding protein
MPKYLVVAAVVVLAACGPKKEATPAADSAAAAPAPAPAATDTSKVAGDTSKTP